MVDTLYKPQWGVPLGMVDGKTASPSVHSVEHNVRKPWQPLSRSVCGPHPPDDNGFLRDVNNLSIDDPSLQCDKPSIDLQWQSFYSPCLIIDRGRFMVLGLPWFTIVLWKPWLMMCTPAKAIEGPVLISIQVHTLHYATNYWYRLYRGRSSRIHHLVIWALDLSTNPLKCTGSGTGMYRMDWYP
jgi:hypothetical protein